MDLARSPQVPLPHGASTMSARLDFTHKLKLGHDHRFIDHKGQKTRVCIYTPNNMY